MTRPSQRPALQCAGRLLDLSRPRIMGIINTTPDSFSDGGSLYRDSALDLERAMARARAQVDAGADILDIGGESTRPGASPVSSQEEIDRVLPLLERIVAELDVVVSVDTSNPELMREAAARGAGMINDVRALERDGALAVAAESGLAVCIMHRQGEPATMQAAPRYEDVVTDVCDYLRQRAEDCVAGGVVRERLVLDPGFGFGKTLQHNFALLAGLERLSSLGLPVLAGLSRKSMIDKVLGRPVDRRLAGSLALALFAAQGGAHILRVHDVAETHDALAMLHAKEHWETL